MGKTSETVIGLVLSLLATGCGEKTGGTSEGPVALNPPGTEWAASFFNPAPADGDLVVDGPCGSRFVFRAIATPTDPNWLADMSVALGQTAPNSGASETEQADQAAARSISEQVRQGAIVGGFAESEDPSRRAYYVGKYEITANQYEAVMQPGCHAPTDAKNVPVEQVSRFDAVEFARRLSEYGFRHSEATAKLPKAGVSPAFVRLPTEAEWEFAARGGASVSVEERLAPAYPMDGELVQFEWHGGDESCRGSTQPVGLLRPNALGLHDMLGNVSEMVSDPFHVNRGGRLHGQPGGITAKGGSCSSKVADIRSATRTEFPDYDFEAGKANAPANVGFRLALGAPAIPSNQRLEAFEQDWDKLRQPHTSAPGQSPSDVLRNLAGKMTDLSLSQTIAEQAGAFDNEMSRRQEIEAKTAYTSVSNGGMLIRNYILAATQARQIRIYMDRMKAAGEKPAQNQVDGLTGAETSLKITRDLYIQSITGAEAFNQKLLDDARRLASDDLRKRYANSGATIPVADMVCMFVSQANHYRENHPATFDEYVMRIERADPADFKSACP